LLNDYYAYILISDKKGWNRLCKRNRNGDGTRVFVRKNRVGPVETQKLFFYIKKPIMQIRGVADFTERLAGDYKELWNTFGAETCFGKFAEYVSFLKGRQTVTFIRFKNFRELENPISLNVIRTAVGVARIPRGGKYLSYKTANELIIRR